MISYLYKDLNVWRQNMETGERIKQLRQQRGITTNRLANLSGVTQSYLRDIELGKKQPTVEYLSYICYGLNITLYDFFKTDTDDELEQMLSRLSGEQKKKLCAFIKSIL